MGQLVLGLAGAFIGNMIAPGIGASVGFALGSFAYTLIDPQKIVGPRLQETKVRGANYGTMRPIVYGTMRVGGLGMGQGSTSDGPNKFTEHEQKSSGKGGPEVTEYSYSLSFWDEICEGPILGVRKRWANARLITDAQDTASSSKWPFTLYLGTDDQMPDPTMETVYGVGEVSPMRGVAYEAHEELDVTDYGNARPNVEYEVYTAIGDEFPYRVSTFHAWDDNPDTGISINTMAAAYANGVISASAMNVSSGHNDYYLQTFDIDGNPLSTLANPIAIGARFGSVRNLNSYWGSPDHANAYWYSPHPETGAITQGTDITATVFGPVASALQGNANIYQNGKIYGVGATNPQTIGRYNAPGGVPGTYDGVSAVLDDNYTAADVALGTGDDGHIYVMVPAGSPACKMWKFDEDLNLIHFWDVADTAGTRLIKSTMTNFAVQDNKVVFDALMSVGPNVFAICCVEIDPDSLALTDVGTPLTHSQSFIIGLGGCRFLDRDGVFSVCPGPATVILGDIVHDLCTRAGLTDAQIDTTDLTQEVRGYLVASQMTIHNAIQALRQAFFFDVAEYDGKVVFRNRGHDAIATIDDGDLAAHEPGSEPPEPLEYTRTPEAELPMRVSINYYDWDADYQPGSQHWSRMVTRSESKVTLDLPIVLTASEALARAQWHMHFAWLERDKFTWFTTRKWSALTPTDVVVVRGVSIRIISKTESPNGLVKFEGVRAFAGAFTGDHLTDPIDGETAGSPPSGQPPQEVPQLAVATRLVLLDIPYCSPGGTQFGFVAAMGRNIAGTWPGATLYKSLDAGTTYTAVASTAAPNVIGASSDALDNYAGDLGDVDEVSEVEVVLTDLNLTLSSCTPDALDNGANLCALGVDGGWELLQFRDATLTAPGTYTLAGFYRGRNGTDAYIATHAIGDTFVLLPATSVNAPEGELEVELTYKAVTFGTALADAGSQLFTNTGLGPAKCIAEQTPYIPPFVGDDAPTDPAPGSVPAPEPGDCAAGKYLDACGTWSVPAGGSGIITKDEGSTVDSAATTLNFTGSGVTATDAGGHVTTVNIPGGGGGDWVRLAQVVTTGSATTITFSSISGAYSALKIFLKGRNTDTTTAGIVCSLKINGDATAGNYTQTQYQQVNGSTTTAGTVTSTTDGCYIADIPGSLGNASSFGSHEITIPYYADTVFFKNVMSTGSVYNNGGVPITNDYQGFVWKSTAAITSLVFKSGGTAFLNGTTATLYAMT